MIHFHFYLIFNPRNPRRDKMHFSFTWSILFRRSPALRGSVYRKIYMSELNVSLNSALYETLADASFKI